MIKTYKAYTSVVISCINKGSRYHIAFDTLTNGTSTYTTTDKDEQEAIESHPWFDSKIYLQSSIDETEQVKKNRRKAAQKKLEQDVHIVQSFTEAQDWLAEKFGISRSKMKTKEEILAQADSCGVKLQGLDIDK